MSTIRRLLGFARRYWGSAGLGVFCMLVVTALNIAYPQFIRIIIDTGLTQKNYKLIPYMAFAIIGSTAIKGIFVFGEIYLSEYVANRTVYDIRNRLFDQIQRLSFSYHDEAETGQLISRATSDVDTVRVFMGGGLLQLVVNILMIFGIASVLIYTNWKLALLAMSAMPFLAVVAIKYKGRIRPLFTSIQDQIGDMTTAIQQNLMGIRVVKAFACEEQEIDKFSSQAYELLERNMKAARVSSFYGPMMDFIAAFGVTFILWYGGMQVINHQLTLGELIAFVTYLMMFIWPVRVLVWVVGLAQNAVAGGDRIFEILDTHPETGMKDGTVELKNCTGHVEFNDVSFAYASGGKVLRNIDLEAKPGEMIALLGSTGSGKSTVINLLPRFYDVTSGAILIDGVDIRKFRLESLRRNIGIVSQETFLFSDTIRGNIAYGRPNASMDAVIEVAKASNIHDFIMTLPHRYETRIGERGVNLSGGQKQRIAIARALLMNPPILIMDDSTSSVDTETESLIQKALVSLTESRTTFVIAQRISTIKRASKIVVLDKGRVAECGTHNELIERGRLYAEIYHLQFKSQEQ